MYLLDTDVLSYLLRRVPSQSLIEKLAAVPQIDQFTSSITLGELVYGAARTGSNMTAYLERLNSVLNIPIIPFDSDAARRYGELRADLERRGTPIGDADTRIAAIALSRDLIVVTGNVRHFERVPGLAVENWLS